MFHFAGYHVVEYSTVGLDSIVFVKPTIVGGHEYVDLGLPSGTMWATCNVGAERPGDYGDYFAWGETMPKEDYSWVTYQLCDGSSSGITKYNDADGEKVLLPIDDAATASWGSEWQMPDWNQIEELCNSKNTTTTWTTQNGVYGRKITSKVNSNSIFLPAAGYRYGENLNSAGSYGYYWTRSLLNGSTSLAYVLRFNSSFIGPSDGSRFSGRSVRPVRKQ